MPNTDALKVNRVELSYNVMKEMLCRYKRVSLQPRSLTPVEELIGTTEYLTQ